MHLRSLFLASLPGLFFCTPVYGFELPACSAPVGESPQIDGVAVEDTPEVEGDYRKLRVTARNQAFMHVYFDEGSQAAARSRAACLGTQLNLLQIELGDHREGAEWSSVVFTQDRNYSPPRGVGIKPRWIAETSSEGDLHPTTQHFIASVIPHEQVHAYQLRAGGSFPRWFTEGHATWVENKVVENISLKAAAQNKVRAEADLAASTAKLDLENWGSVRPRREAIMRQVSAEDREKMEADPNFFPQGTFRFTSEDLIGDESNMQARYAGAWQVFLELEVRFGIDAVRTWVTEVTASPGHLSQAELSDHFEQNFAVPLTDFLKLDLEQAEVRQ